MAITSAPCPEIMHDRYMFLCVPLAVVTLDILPALHVYTPFRIDSASSVLKDADFFNAQNTKGIFRVQKKLLLLNLCD